jgi:hypothetical protein
VLSGERISSGQKMSRGCREVFWTIPYNCFGGRESLLDRGNLPNGVLRTEKVFWTDELFRTENVLKTKESLLDRD